MPFSCRRGSKLLCLLAGLCSVLGVSILLSCEAKITGQEDVFPDAAQRVEDNLLPEILDESEAVLRNLVNLLTAFPEVCATPLAELGTFVSSLPALMVPQDGPRLDEETGSWEVSWQDVVLGEAEPSVDVTVIITFRNQAGNTLRAVPFTLVPASALPTAGAPASFACPPTETTGCFFLFQDNTVEDNTPGPTAGQWTLRWRNVSNIRVFFEGRISATAVTRLRRRLAEDAPVVATLGIDAQTSEVTFNESTESMQDKGFTFFVRPGDTIRFQLRLGPEEEDLQNIGRNQLRVGPDSQLLPLDDDPANFVLTSNVPIKPENEPVSRDKLGTFIWQDVEMNDCSPGEERWRIRFSTAGAAAVFSGMVSSLNEERETEQPLVTAVGQCPDGDIDDGRNFNYDCPLQDDTTSGYDLCVSRGQLVAFTPGVDQGEGVVRDPGLVFIGADKVMPPSPDPFDIFFDIALMERQSARNLEFSNTRIVLRGNSDEEGVTPLDPDQVSLDPRCSVPGEQGQPRVRFTGTGDYSTQRFEGSTYTLEDVEFTTENVHSGLVGLERFPDSGDILLVTRLADEIENTDITVPMDEIQLRDNGVIVPVDVEMSIQGVIFNFPDARFPEQVKLAVE